MRKTMIVLAVAMMPALAAAEELKVGTIQVNGGSTLNLGTGSMKVTQSNPGVPDVVADTDVTTIGLDVGGLYYLTPNVGIGLELGYDRRKEEIAPETTIFTQYFIGPKAGVDFGIAPQVSVFGELALGYVKYGVDFTDSSNPANNNDYEAGGWGYRIGAGVKYFPVPALSLDGGLVLEGYKVTYDGPNGFKEETKESNFGLRGGISVYFGGK